MPHGGGGHGYHGGGGHGGYHGGSHGIGTHGSYSGHSSSSRRPIGPEDEPPNWGFILKFFIVLALVAGGGVVAVFLAEGNQQSVSAATGSSGSRPYVDTINDCSAMVKSASAGIHTGPGTEYGFLTSAAQNDLLRVDGTDSDRRWLLVQNENVRGWIFSGDVTLVGICNKLQAVR